MDKNFLQLRDQGCQGAWEIFQRARKIREGAAPRSDYRPRLALFFNAEESAQLSLWQETARRLNGTSVVLSAASPAVSGNPSDIPAVPVDADMLVAGDMEPAVLDRLVHALTVPVVNAGNAKAQPCRVLADLLTLVKDMGPAADKLDAVRVCWVGLATGAYAGLANSWLDSTLCFQHEFFMAFPEGTQPDADHLDFAMNAGGKIFLSYDPSAVTEDAHALVVTPWEIAGPGALMARHPLVMDPDLIDKARLFSFVDAPTAPNSWESEREANLLACQMAIVEYMAAKHLNKPL